MKKIFIDTNFWVRFFIQDIKDQYQMTRKLISQIEEGHFRVYTSVIVLLELQFVLRRLYHLSFEGVVEVLEAVSKTRNITIIEKTSFNLAFNFFKTYKINFPDCLIASQLPKNAILVSFDEELSKIRGIVVKSPQAVLA